MHAPVPRPRRAIQLINQSNYEISFSYKTERPPLSLVQKFDLSNIISKAQILFATSVDRDHHGSPHY
jgi:hypothetical protein